MHKNIKNVAIVGGGTSAWFAAAFLSSKTNLNITVIDKEVGAPVGVGEGTLLNFKLFLEDCGFPLEEWFDAIDATYKSGILFPQFCGDKNLVWHPFGVSATYPEYNTNIYELLTHADKTDRNELLPLFHLSLDGNVNLNDIDTNYALHVDCSKLVDFLQKQLENKVTIIKSEVVTVNREDNTVTSLLLKNGSEIIADLYVDCTGFKQLLQYKPNRVNLTNRLFCDTAVAGHVPYNDIETERLPYVESCAVDHGWIWKIPVRTRIGTGLVFKRDITSIDEAKQYLCEHWDNRISPDNLKVIDWTPYYNTNMWDGNVVAVGLSGGFIEPLESTGLGTIIDGIKHLQTAIVSGYYNEFDISLFNTKMISLYEDAIDFINMHYVYSDKDTPFWNHVADNIIPSETYLYYKKMLENGDPLNLDGKLQFFGGANWLCWMTQIEDNVAKTKHLDENIANTLLAYWKRQGVNSYVENQDNTHTSILGKK